jgi:osmotically-inducible protein OsmY
MIAVRIIVIGSLLFMLQTVTGCVPAVAVGTVAVGTSMAGERSAGHIVDDALITTKIKNQFAQKYFNNLFSRITVISKEGRVLLTGSVVNGEYVAKASEIVWQVEGVTEVINEIEVADKGLKERAIDSLIANQVRAKYLFTKNIRSVNYTIDANNGVIYLTGIAQSKEELDLAIDIASKVSNVKRVVSHVVLKEDARRH